MDKINKILNELAKALSNNNITSKENIKLKKVKARISNGWSGHKGVRDGMSRIPKEVYTRVETRRHYDRIVALLAEEDSKEGLKEDSKEDLLTNDEMEEY